MLSGRLNKNNLSNKVKIAHVQLLPLLTGVQNVTLSELCNLSDNFEKHVICQSKGPLTKVCHEQGYKYHTIPSLIRNISPLQDLKSFYHLYKLFKENKFDIVHTHSSKTGVLGRLAAKLAKVPVIVHTVHGFPFDSTNNKVLRGFYALLEVAGALVSDKIICLHEDDKNICIKKLGIRDDKIKVLRNGVDLCRFFPADPSSKSSIKQELGIDDNQLVVGMIGRLWEQKNPHALVSSAIDLLKKRNDVVFVFIGEGELEAELKLRARAYQQHIRFLGWRNDTESILRAFDIFCLPSKWEGMPLAIIEAMASGLPCVVSDIPGNKHLIEHGKNGSLFSLLRETELTSCLSELLGNQEVRAEMGRINIEISSEQHDVVSRTCVLEKLYEQELVNKSKG
ncbi:Glycosyltransferase family 4 protein [Vibrio chagasii]|nr:Glycosyltransferase family 4 protein [Vibrio chagasii]